LGLEAIYTFLSNKPRAAATPPGLKGGYMKFVTAIIKPFLVMIARRKGGLPK
jgi:hypothetical protein